MESQLSVPPPSPLPSPLQTAPFSRGVPKVLQEQELGKLSEDGCLVCNRCFLAEGPVRKHLSNPTGQKQISTFREFGMRQEEEKNRDRESDNMVDEIQVCQL